MPTVVGVRFKDSGKTYHFDPCDVPLAVGDWVIVETVRGPELARIAAPPQAIPQEEVLGELKPVLRRASQSDINNLALLQQYVDEALEICAEKVAQHKLPMNLIKAEYNFDGSRLTFFFTADKRVDFRALVRDLARTFHTRIELRQVGPRDEAKLLGGVGPCGRLLCCSTFLPDFARVSIKMAKDQDLPLNPTKISGVCGRLLCCLSYEHEQYLEIKAQLPAIGAWVKTAEGPGEVIAINVVRETATVELSAGNTIDCTAQAILEVTDRVAAEARARNAEGITPAARMRIDTGHEGDISLLAELEDQPPAPPAPPIRLEAALAPTIDSGARTGKSERRSPEGRETGDRREPDAGRQRTAPNLVARALLRGVQRPGEQRDGLEGEASQGSQSQTNGGLPLNGGGRRRRRGRGGESR